MIVLFNPWSTPSPKKPLPMSLLASARCSKASSTTRSSTATSRPIRSREILAIAARQPLTAIASRVMPGPQLRAAVSGCRQLEAQCCRSVPIVWGGYFPSQHADACLSERTVDVCVLGQGEQTIVELMRGDPRRRLVVVDRRADLPAERHGCMRHAGRAR